MALLLIEDFSLKYPRSEHLLLEKLDITLQQGEMLLLHGPNGCGKTSLLNAICGIVPQRIKAEVQGSISLNGTDLNPIALNQRLRFLAYQMSDPDTQMFFPRGLKELSFALENLGLPRAEIQTRIYEAARAFGLESMLYKDPALLSLGQKKLLLTAVCSAMQTPLILLDEPVQGLDKIAFNHLTKWLQESLASGTMIVAAEHDPRLNELATQIVELGE